MKKVVMMIVSFALSSSLLSHKYEATISEITPEIQVRMKYSWNDKSPVSLSDLHYISLLHYDFEGYIQKGELIVHKEVADEVIEIFRQLFEIKFPIRKMHLIDEYKGMDFYSIISDNSYAFCSRNIAGKKLISNHAYGLAIDINPWENPCLHGLLLKIPAIAYFDRDNVYHGIITPETEIYKIFKRKGWEWGGECFGDDYKDYHHFQKVIPTINKTKNVKEGRELFKAITFVPQFVYLYSSFFDEI